MVLHAAWLKARCNKVCYSTASKSLLEARPFYDIVWYSFVNSIKFMCIEFWNDRQRPEVASWSGHLRTAEHLARFGSQKGQTVGIWTTQNHSVVCMCASKGSSTCLIMYNNFDAPDFGFSISKYVHLAPSNFGQGFSHPEKGGALVPRHRPKQRAQISVCWQLFDVVWQFSQQ